MTDEQKEAYMVDSNLCPFCLSNDITISDRTQDGDELLQVVTCEICSKQWREIYRFIDVEEI